jgi:hypothetical protein
MFCRTASIGISGPKWNSKQSLARGDLADLALRDLGRPSWSRPIAHIAGITGIATPCLFDTARDERQQFVGRTKATFAAGIDFLDRSDEPSLRGIAVAANSKNEGITHQHQPNPHCSDAV